MKKVSVIVVMLGLLTACTTKYSSSAEKVYLGSRNGPPLVVPSPLSTANISQFYILPPQNQDAQVSIVPYLERPIRQA